MCSGSNKELGPAELVMENELKKQNDKQVYKFSLLLELSAGNDLIGFKQSIEEEGLDVDEASFWYGRAIGSKKMGLQERTPLMISAMFGNKEVVKYILSTGLVDVNRACGSDGATALHCAAAGGFPASSEIVRLLLDASADVNSVDAHGRRPGDVIASVARPSFYSTRKTLEILLKGSSSFGEELVSSVEGVDLLDEQLLLQTPQKDGSERKEYPVDLTMPDIKNGIYGTDEFRMYTFKVKPCSRAYSHDWTECPFVHPGENARRRDPRKFHYSCVPCPEFRKGACRQGDACEYAHGVFECWLHPAQYKTRLCKDETGCTRRVCFFAHKPEELRPLYASTGSAVPSPRSSSNNSSLDMSGMSPLALGSPSMMMLPTSTPPMSPSAAVSSPMGGSGWQNQSSLVPPMLQLPGSRLKSALSARDVELEMELLGFDSPRRHQHQSLMNEMSNISSPSSWSNSMATVAALAASSGGRTGDYGRHGGVRPTNLEDVFGSLDPSVLSQLQGLNMKASASQMNSPTGIQIRQNINQQLRSSYPSNIPSSPVRSPSPFNLDPSTAAAIMSSRSAAFAKRSQSFIDRGAFNRHLGASSLANSGTTMSSTLSDWGSPTGKLDWGIQGEELNKLRKSASFGLRSSNGMSSNVDEPDVSWVQTLVKDVQPVGNLRYGPEEAQPQYHLNSGGSEMMSPWMEQLYMEQEQLVA
ncbi:Zinc finger ccch domain-containing protein [Thalictrum thalictroides]|uniref:Zinc finger ccch domain-containing protein n=1 Tax=Thalictrum thalictroides TaxID=46969 RepID=A0A7J6XA70_THATH|nr:Zinc finger ccch domain-containing protein [Thalictrum thalictroides]